MFPLQFVVDATEIATTNSNTATAIPNDGSGNRAQVVLVSCTVATYLKVGESSGTAVAAAGDSVIVNPEHQLLLSVQGQTHIGHIRIGGTSGRTSIQPVDNGPYLR
jgi:hypothetical protein